MLKINKLLTFAFIVFTHTINAATQDVITMPSQPQNTTPNVVCKSNMDWSEPTFARHIYGNTWYVGTCAISVILIATPKGHFLIDGATEAAVPSIKANITSLGVKLSDIKYILTTHEHIDHVGGVAKLQSDTGAVVISRTAAANSLTSGQGDPRDPQFTSLEAFTPITNLKTIRDKEQLTLGDSTVHNLPMPGHTPNGSGWSWKECEADKCLNIIFSDSLSSISNKFYRFSKPNSIAKELIATTKRLEKMQCDILLTGHDMQSNLLNRLDGKVPLINVKACKELAKLGRTGLKKRIENEKLGKAP